MKFEHLFGPVIENGAPTGFWPQEERPMSTSTYTRRGHPGSTGRLRPRAALATLAIAALAIAGCSSPGGDTNAKRTAGPVSLPKATSDIPQLTWALTKGEPSSIAPAMAADFSSQTVVKNLCDGISLLNADNTTSPSLATTTQADPKTLVLKVREGVKFWDGKPLTAKDVAYSLNYAARPTSTWSFVYAKVDAIKQTGTDEVTVTFKQPDPLFTKELVTPAGLVMQAEHAEKVGDKLGTPDGGVMCSGPFELKKWTPGSNIDLVRNDDYWNSAWKAHAKNLTFEFVDSTTALSSGLQSGKYDGAYEVTPSVVNSLESGSGGQVTFGPGGFMGLMPTRAEGPMGDPELRKALSVSIDRKGISKAAFTGQAEPNYTAVTSNYWSWNPETKAMWQPAYAKFAKEFALDIAKAKKMVGSTSYAGEPIKLGVLAGDETQSVVSQLIQQNAKKASMNIEIVPLQAIPYQEAAAGTPNRLKDLDVLLVAAYGGVPDPVEFSAYFGPGAYFNFTGDTTPEVQDLYAKASVTFDEKEKARLLIKAQDLYMDQLVITTFVNTPEIMYLKKGLTGATTTIAYLNQPALAKIGAK